jgi:hypothetical protein
MARSGGRWSHHRAASGRWGWRGAGAGQRAGSRPGLFLLGSAVVILLVGVLVGPLLAKVASHDAFGRADTHVDRWVAAHRTNDVNQAAHSATDAAETPTIAALAVLTIAAVALAWQCWREPMLVAVATGEVLIFLTITLLLPRHG